MRIINLGRIVLVGACCIGLVVALSFGLVAVFQMETHASAATLPPRPNPPTVQRLEIFTCTEERAYACADRLKAQYERWAEKASDVRIGDRQISVGVGQSDAGSYGGHRAATVVMTLSVFYEVSEWRAKTATPTASPR